MKYFIYVRKSSESEDRQVQSINDQKNVLQCLAKEKNLKVVRIFEESTSAKAPNRKVFNEMLSRIHAGDASGILCWKLDRLSRNPVDGGNISWSLQQNIIQNILTPEREYRPSDNVLLMAVELGMANQFILDLSKNVKRGNRSKWEKGWPTTPPPIGYMNDTVKKTIIHDPERFYLVRKIWDKMLTGAYKPAQVAGLAADKWGLTTRRKRVLGNPVSTSTVYSILKNSFYYGEFIAQGEIFQGAYKPMITRGEFDRVQYIIGNKKPAPRPSKKRFSFTGLITCGECGCQITAEEKLKKIKSTGESKSYTYYHCTRKRNY
jgi:site-specific DNA recombinase